MTGIFDRAFKNYDKEHLTDTILRCYMNQIGRCSTCKNHIPPKENPLVASCGECSLRKEVCCDYRSPYHCDGYEYNLELLKEIVRVE